MRIAHISTQRGWHGGEQQARLLVEGLTARGHESLVLARRGGKFAEQMAAAHRVAAFAGGSRSPRALWQVRRHLASWRPDVIHFHDSHALSLGGLAAWRLPIGARLAARRVDFPIRSPWRYRFLADRVIAVSTAVATVCASAGLDDSRVVVVHDGTEPARCVAGDRGRGRQALGLAQRQPLLLTIATLTDHKGHIFLLEAMVSVTRQFPEAVLVLAGDGELRTELELQARRLGVSHAVRFVGYRQDVPDLLQAADLFVLPSHLEGLGSSLIDAMFAQRPIVTTTAGGIPDLVGSRGVADPEVALLVRPRDPRALAEAIERALKDPRALAPLVERARSRALAEFSADRMVEKTLAAYEDVLSRSDFGTRQSFRADGGRPVDQATALSA